MRRHEKGRRFVRGKWREWDSAALWQGRGRRGKKVWRRGDAHSIVLTLILWLLLRRCASEHRKLEKYRTLSKRMFVVLWSVDNDNGYKALGLYRDRAFFRNARIVSANNEHDWHTYEVSLLPRQWMIFSFQCKCVQKVVERRPRVTPFLCCVICDWCIIYGVRLQLVWLTPSVRLFCLRRSRRVCISWCFFEVKKH